MSERHHDEFLTVYDVALILRLNTYADGAERPRESAVRAVYHRRKKGLLPAPVDGRPLLWRRDDILAIAPRDPEREGN